MKNIKSLMSEEVRVYIKYLLSSSKAKKFPKSKKIIVALAADYGNMGDIAITVAETQWLKKNFPDYEICDWPISGTYEWAKSLKKSITEDDIIVLTGGGNTGDLYPSIELCRQFIIKHFPNNKIISFPQTVSHSDEKKMSQCIKVYGSHSNLRFSFREKYSYEYAKANFKNKCVLCPDTVFLLNVPEYKGERQNVSLILRQDMEGILSEKEKADIEDKLKEHFGNINVFDTVFVKDSSLDATDRQEKLFDFLKKIQKSTCVVTDRLHAMIFCLITQTPCVVLPIKGVKTKGVLEWVKDSDYIKYCESGNIADIADMCKNMPRPKKCDWEKYFQPLKDLFENY